MRKTTQVTLEQAERVIEILKKHPCVLDVQIFGSVAATGYGNDLDLILVCAEQYEKSFHSQLEAATTINEHLEDLCPTIQENAPAKLREQVIVQILGDDFGTLLKRAKNVIHPATLDLLITASNS